MKIPPETHLRVVGVREQLRVAVDRFSQTRVADERRVSSVPQHDNDGDARAVHHLENLVKSLDECLAPVGGL